MTQEQMGLFETPVAERAPLAKEAPTFRVDARLGVFRYAESLSEHLMKVGLSRGRIRLAHDLVVMEPGLTPVESRALFMAVIVGLEAQSQGSTFVPLASKGAYFKKRLKWLIPQELAAEDGRWEPARLVEALAGLLKRDDLQILGQEGDWKPLLVEKRRLYHQRMSLHERRLVEALAGRLERPVVERPAGVLEQALAEIEAKVAVVGDGEIRLNEEQKKAALTALKMPLTIITGGPGTGKTSIVVSILRLLMRLGVGPSAMALAAPTGKAANRMAESIRGQLARLKTPSKEDERLLAGLSEPKTLHRLLGYSPRRDSFHHHRGNPLAEQVVIVDEASMIDLFMMERLLGAVGSGAQLVLLGDADQLPSVDTGAVLRDLVPQEGDEETPTAHCAVRLKTSYRMSPEDPAGREILVFAGSIRDLEPDGKLKIPEAVKIEGELKDGVGLWTPEQNEGRGEAGDVNLRPFVDWWFDAAVLGGDRQKWKRAFNATYEIDEAGRVMEASAKRLKEVLAHYGRARVLTLTRVFSTGSNELNEQFHRAMARLGSGRLGADYRFHPGEPVMMTRNDYERDLFNGDQGIVAWCRGAGGAEQDVKLMALFERGGELRAYSLGELGKDLEHAFAMTVHKAQGSEFRRVALVLPAVRMTLLNKELLYTAVTRASKGVLVVGRGGLLEAGAREKSLRFSAVGEKLGEATRQDATTP